ncbi:FKBP-type peptidyl-prolyl cis-trans isomerase FklB [Mariprofundus aestuarium]|uniref:Peptidyl-prolyl cis-trans isomerase n=1 Tax=Mariprofundus aestuarium TaxID=1921086 RepID=A0A2K8KYW8_MARES|nr:FKBP-type peptidyl-prolyl cis-trans isomerase [Mariprofundus aestuarium]ATX80123.1 FKBP-type peptidyl-prolyl cis-trans isomerase FklB [Mariprofundus aestuarium]
MKFNSANRPTLFFIAFVALLTLAGCGSSEQETKAEGVAAENFARGKAFLEENATKEGVITLPSGIQYKVISDNPEGKIPKLTDSVHIHIRTLLVDGTVITNTYPSGKAAEIYIKNTLGGWKKVLTKMSVGSKWIAYIPPHMAFSSRGSEYVGPNETLICEIELVDIIW